MNMKTNEILDRLAMAREAQGVAPEPANVGQTIGMPMSDRILEHGARASGDPAAAKFVGELER
jgi:hypothetical protein